MASNLRSRTIREELLEESEEQPILDGDDTDGAEDHVSEQSEESLSDGEESRDELDSELESGALSERLLQSRARGRPSTILKGVNGHKLRTETTSRQSGRLSEAAQNIIPGPVNTEASTIEEFWSLLINDEIINLIVQHTNAKIEDVCAKMMAEDQDTQTYHHHTDANEIKAYIGLLYYSGMWKQSSVHYERLWDRSNGTTIYRCTMSKARFMFLSSSLRFDDKTTRSATDKFGPIRAVWDIFIRNCQRYYKPHNNCTVEEQLLDFRGRCSFRMYIKSKPDKYGLKIVSLNDACTSYMYNAIPYLGKTSTPPNESVSEYFLREVTAPIHGTNRNVTCDNWFTSVPITKRLLEAPYRLRITGTIRKNKPEIPQAMKIAEREPPASKYYYDDNLTLVSYTPKKNKVVLLLTSYLHGNNKETDGKPDIVDFYNKNKGGTDSFDMLCHSFTVSRRTNRWPMRIFFGILDQAAVNARILLKCKNSVRGDTSKVTAESCLNRIYLHLVKAHLQERYTNPTNRKDIKCGIANVLHLQDRPAFGEDRPKLDRKQRCQVCPKGTDRKTGSMCPTCLRPMCDKHRAYLCVECAYGNG